MADGENSSPMREVNPTTQLDNIQELGEGEGGQESIGWVFSLWTWRYREALVCSALADILAQTDRGGGGQSDQGILVVDSPSS